MRSGCVDQHLARRVADDHFAARARPKRRSAPACRRLARNDFGPVRSITGDQAVGGAEVDADDRASGRCPKSICMDMQFASSTSRSGSICTCRRFRTSANLQPARRGRALRPSSRTSAASSSIDLVPHVCRTVLRPLPAAAAPIIAARSSSSAIFSSKTSSSSSGGTSFVRCSPMSKPSCFSKILAPA